MTPQGVPLPAKAHLRPIAHNPRMEPQIHYCTTSDGVNIAWSETGQGPALLILQATPFSHVQQHFATFEASYAELARSFRLIMFDARGTGLSERDVADVSSATLLMDAQAVVEAAKLDRFIVSADMNLLALSTALQLATVLPERVTHLALESPYQNMNELAETPYGRVALALAEADWNVYVQTTLRVLAGFDSAESTWLDPYAKAAAGWVDPSVGRRYLRLQKDTDVGDLLARVRQPTLVTRHANMVPARCCQRIAAKIAGAQFRQSTDPNFDEWAEVVRAFVEQTSPLGSPSSVDEGRPHPDLMQRLGDDTIVASPESAPQSFAAGRYVVSGILGEGGQKVVYLVHDTALDRDCALALIRGVDLGLDDLMRFQREAQAMARLGAHSNIVSVFDIGEQDGRPFLVSEYIAGGDLRQLLLKRGRLPPAEALAVGSDIARALAVAHGRGVVHRDVKPPNIWLTEDGAAKLGDFGLAFSLDRSRLTMPGTIMGTAAYLAPEQALGEPVTERSDLYALGCVLYEMVCGRPPFADANATAVIAQHINATPAAPSSHEPGVPPALEVLILRLLAKTPGQRPESASAVLEELRRIGNSAGAMALPVALPGADGGDR